MGVRASAGPNRAGTEPRREVRPHEGIDIFSIARTETERGAVLARRIRRISPRIGDAATHDVSIVTIDRTTVSTVRR